MKAAMKLMAVGMVSMAFALASCSSDDDTDYRLSRPTALVTVRPGSGDGFTMQLDDNTVLTASNLKASPFGSKEVRALVNYTDEAATNGGVKSVRVNWIDSIRTKQPVATAGADNDRLYGNDPVEIVKDWVTVAEDGYLTLRVRTLWGGAGRVHYLNLLTGTNAADAYELELRHDAKGDKGGLMGDALVAFNLNDLPRQSGDNVKIKLNWLSFSGKKSAEFSLHLHAKPQEGVSAMPLNSLVR